MGVEQKLGNMGVVTTTLENVVNWSRTNAMWPMLFGLACCAIEMMAAQASHFDMSRFGMELMRASPRQSDLMIVAGRVSRKMAPVLRRLYDQMPEPKWVIAMGDCASCTGVFNNYALVQGVDEVVPVDVYVPGCPPRPEALLEGIMRIQDKIMRHKIAKKSAADGVRGSLLDIRKGEKMEDELPVSHPYGWVAAPHDRTAIYHHRQLSAKVRSNPIYRVGITNSMDVCANSKTA